MKYRAFQMSVQTYRSCLAAGCTPACHACGTQIGVGDHAANATVARLPLIRTQLAALYCLSCARAGRTLPLSELLVAVSIAGGSWLPPHYPATPLELQRRFLTEGIVVLPVPEDGVGTAVPYFDREGREAWMTYKQAAAGANPRKRSG